MIIWSGAWCLVGVGVLDEVGVFCMWWSVGGHLGWVRGLREGTCGFKLGSSGNIYPLEN